MVKKIHDSFAVAIRKNSNNVTWSAGTS